MSLVLSHGYFLADDPVEQKIMRPYPPLGLLSISAWLDRQGVVHEVIDNTFLTEPAFLARMDELRPRMVAFYVTLMTRKVVLRLIRQLRASALHAGIKVVLGGPDGRYNAADYLAHGVDLLVVGEGEETMATIAALPDADLADPAVLAGIPGLAYRAADGQAAFSPSRAHLPKLDELPVPARHRIDLSPYFRAWRGAHGQTSLNVSTQRGCPYSCSWCSRAVYGKSYRRRAADKVVAELAELTRLYQPDQFWFVDDVFTVNHRWLREFAEALDAAGLRIRYECITRADRMSPEVVELLARTGCIRVWIGAESGSQRILDSMNRQVTVEAATAMIRAASEAGIETGTFLMLGYPGEEEVDILNTLQYLKNARPDRYTVTLAYPIKGTELYSELSPHVTSPDFAEGSDRENRFPRTYSERYYAHALAYLTHEVAWDQEKNHLHPRALRLKLRAWRSRAGMLIARWQVPGRPDVRALSCSTTAPAGVAG
ncbi:radical SAM protein [Niveispirillum sp. BGYR6]|uniref:B12-binding domain-containing radical SAM protein n=1 Tax=Niveispirillum sp. BGYR6 TaxID=2971249 RepID=UPI0022B957E1|nr:radical SAM protein [Niveispirillum sp. BGYR6]MDG5497992.1 radical SAM protein [Niveispirillum sp. BGYR6]